MAETDTLLAALLPLELPALRPATQAALREWARRQRHRLGDDGAAAPPRPSFPYQDLPPSARLAYELVGWSNVGAYLPLFAADPSPFVDVRFKHRAALETYAVALLTDLRYSWKRGGCDWLVRRRTSGEALGILHLYDLSYEIIGPQVPHCSVGYTVAAPLRRQDYGLEALRHLLAQAAGLFGRTEARALSADGNLASEALLRRSGFAVLDERPAAPGRAAERLWRRGLL